MNLLRSTRYVHGKKTPLPLIKRKYWRQANFAVVFCSMTLVFSLFFQTFTEGESFEPNQQDMAIVSTQNEPGVTSPDGATLDQPSADSTTTNIGQNDVRSQLSTIPPKPDWVKLPLYTDKYNSASQYLATNPNAEGATYISRMAAIPVAQWFGNWNLNIYKDVDTYVSAATAEGSVPVLVVYNIPYRDCGGYSVGGANTRDSYINWVNTLAAGIGNRTAVVILEPDALGALDCLPSSVQRERTLAIAQAVTSLKSNTKTSVYVDAGTPVWQPADVMANRLKDANVEMADGFSLNVSYFASTSANRNYGDRLSKMVGNKHYVIDTSRNGGNHSVTGMQCNPSFASFGDLPTANTGNQRNDALLWIKIPWESDGPCDGSPPPGKEYWSYALNLARNAGW